MSSVLRTPAHKPRVPAFFVAMVVFGVAVLIGNLLVMRFVAPTMLRNVAITHLKPTLVQIVLLVYASTFVAALIAGAASAYRGFRRGSVSRAGNFVSAVFGTLLAAGALITIALASRQPVPGRATVINLILIAVGAFLGCLLVEIIRGRGGMAQPTSQPPATPSGLVAGLLLLSSPVSQVGAMPQLSHVDAIEASAQINPLDIEAKNCVARSIELAFDADVTVFSISLGPHFAYQEVGYASGRWDADVTSGLKAGIKLVLGAHVGSNLVQGGVSMELEADGLLTAVNVYDLESQLAADHAVKWNLLNYVADSVVLPALAGLIKPAITPTGVGLGLANRTPKEVDLELAGSLKLNVTAGAGFGASVGFTLGPRAGLKLMHESQPSPIQPAPNTAPDPKSDPLRYPTNAAIYVGLNGAVDAGITAPLVGVTGNTTGDLVLEMGVEPTALQPGQQQIWAPTDVSVAAVGKLEGSAGVSLANLGGALTIGSKIEVDSALSFKEHPLDAPALASFFGALEPVLSGRPTPAQRANLENATKTFAAVLAKDGTAHVMAYQTTGGNVSFEVAVGDIIAFGASAQASTTTEHALSGAAFLDAARRWQYSQTCPEKTTGGGADTAAQPPPSAIVQWKKATSATGAPRLGGALAYSALDRGLIYYLPSSQDETWKWDGQNWIKLSPTTHPALSSTAGMAFDSVRQQLLLLGSRAHGSLETWAWDHGDWHLLQTNSAPGGRTAASLAFDAAHGKLLLFSGRDVSNGSLLNDTWLWDGQAWTKQTSLVSPTPKPSMPMAYVPGRGPLLFGGCLVSVSSGSNCFWRWNGTQWNPVTVPLTPAAGSYWMVYEPNQSPSRVSLIGRSTAGHWLHWSGDDGSYWLARDADGQIPSSASFTLAFDEAHGQLVVLGGPTNTWTAREPSWSVFGCGAPAAFCDGIAKTEKRRLGLDPYNPSTANDGIPDRWKLIPPPGDAVFGPFSPADGANPAQRSVNLDAHLCPPIPDNNCIAANGMPAPRFALFNHRPDLWHKDVYVEIDWESCALGGCPGQIGPLNLDPLHHAPNLRGLQLVIDMFERAPVINADGTSGVHLNVLVNQAIPHNPSCAQPGEDTGGIGPTWRWQYFGTGLSTSLTANRGSIFRYVLSAHSTALGSTPPCNPPGLGPLPPIGDLPDYDWSPFGLANVGGRTIVMSGAISWICPAILGGCYTSPAPFRPIYPNAAANDPINGVRHSWPFPVADLLGFGNVNSQSPAIHNDGWVQVWSRAFAHLLGVSLGLTDAEARNDPAAPGLFANGALQVRPPDSYARWTGLILAPNGPGFPYTVPDGQVPYHPDFNALQPCVDPTFTGQGPPLYGRDQSGRVTHANDPCITRAWNWQ